MKEKVWLHIPQKYRGQLTQWSSFYSYDSLDDELGEVFAYNLISETNEYQTLVEYLSKNDIQYNVFRREFSITKKEINEAEILKLIIDGNAGDSLSSDHKGFMCHCCKEKVRNIQINKLHVNVKQIKKYDISATYMGDTEIIVSERLKKLLIQENISGIAFQPVFELGKKGQEIPGFFHLRLEEGIGEVVDPSIVQKDGRCFECGFYKKFLCQTPLYFKKSTWKGLDICFTENWFGSPPITQGKWIIISKKLYQVLIKNKIKIFSVEPAFIVD